MKKIDKDMEDILSLDDKRELLKELGHESLIDELFMKGYKATYKPAVNKQNPLDQQVSFSISEEEKSLISDDLADIRKVGPRISISAYIRNKIVTDIDLKDWADRAEAQLKMLEQPEFDVDYLNKQRRHLLLEMEEVEYDSELKMLNKQMKELNESMELLKKQSFKRKYRVSGRITFNEAQIIRWRAARLNLTIADYLRYLVYDYVPGGMADLNLSLQDRKRFYISILDVYKNGWGQPEELDQCPNCVRYMNEIQKLKAQIERYKVFIKEGGL